MSQGGVFNAGAAVAMLGLDTNGFTGGILQAQSIAAIFPGVVRDFLANPLLGIISVAKEAGRALVGMVMDVTTAADAVGKTAENLGVSVEWLDAWGKAAAYADVNAQEFAQAINWMSRQAYEASQGNEQAGKGFIELGVKIFDASGKLRSIEQIAADVSDSLARMEPGFNRTGVAMEVLGRGSGNLIGFMSQGTRAIDEQIGRLKGWGVVVTAENAKNSASFNDLLTDFSMVWGGIKNALAEPIREALTPKLKDMLKWVQDHPDDIKKWINQITDAIKDLAAEAGKLATLIGENADAIKKGFQIWQTITNPVYAVNKAYHYISGDQQTDSPKNVTQKPIQQTISRALPSAPIINAPSEADYRRYGISAPPGGIQQAWGGWGGSREGSAQAMPSQQVIINNTFHGGKGDRKLIREVQRKMELTINEAQARQRARNVAEGL